MQPKFVSQGVEVVIAGNIGPHAYKVLSSAGIKIYVGASGKVSKIGEQFKLGQLKEAGSGDFGPGRTGGWIAVRKKSGEKS